MQYDLDSRGKFAEIFHSVRKILLSYPRIKEVKNPKQTSYMDEHGAIIMMRQKGEHYVLAFGKGTKLAEKYPQLTGNGKVVRHLILSSLDELDESLLREMIEESFILGVEAHEMRILRHNFM